MPHVFQDTLGRMDKVNGGTSSAPKPRSASTIGIIDIRSSGATFDLKEQILSSLRPKEGPKTLPTLILYDERGLKIFEEITYLSEYYLTNAEINVLEQSAESIAKALPSNSMLVELGSGNLRKVSILLRALEKASKNIDYYALDVSLEELHRTLDQVPMFNHVRCHGLYGTYDDGFEWLKLPENVSRPKCVMSLGSSIGNFKAHGAVNFLRSFSEYLSPQDTILVGLDATQDPAKVFHAYNDREGVTQRFNLNGLARANEILGEVAFNPEDWKAVGEFVFDSQGCRHQMFYVPLRHVSYRDISFFAGEKILAEQSFKYSPAETAQLWETASLSEIQRWSASSHEYNIHLLRKRDMQFSSHASIYAETTTPSIGQWNDIWSVWDHVTRQMLPNEELLSKPIKLRNACIFYLGHIPTFLDININKVCKEPLCEPSYYPRIFERGIDPDVDNPEQCHEHSEIPASWPPMNEILQYQAMVREKVRRLHGAADIPRSIGRVLWLGFEHEVMHLETLLYILIQSDKTRPPFATSPNFAQEAKDAKSARVPNEWFHIPEQTITIGLEDNEDDLGPDTHFGWDIERPRRRVVVPAFEAQGRPLTNEDYGRYLVHTHKSQLPASWAEHISCHSHSNGNNVQNGYTNGFDRKLNGHGNHQQSLPLTKEFLDGKFVRTTFGLVPLEHCLDWPVSASYDEVAGCALWMGGRIPTFVEARSIYSHADGLKLKEAEHFLGKTVPAVNSHLVNDGVEESPGSRAFENKEGSTELFTNLAGANVGFKHWHPVAVTANGNKLAGQSDMGGVWEWTSSPLTKHEGFEPMALYPAYAADFFDGKHNIMLGGSWATHPRIAGRKTFVNWYQRNYLYAWAGARLVRDL